MFKPALSFESNPIGMDTLKLESIRLDYTPYAILSLAFFFSHGVFLFTSLLEFECVKPVLHCVFSYIIYMPYYVLELKEFFQIVKLWNSSP